MLVYLNTTNFSFSVYVYDLLVRHRGSKHMEVTLFRSTLMEMCDEKLIYVLVLLLARRILLDSELND